MRNRVRCAVTAIADRLRSQYEELGTLGVIFLVAGGLRSYYFPSVFRGEDIVHIQVDPWKYQVHIERLTEQRQGPFDHEFLADPGRVVGAGRGAGLTPTGQDDLMVTTLAWVAELFGGTPHDVGVVLALYPVVCGVALCLLVYLATGWLTESRGAALAAAGAIAITPANVYRTTLGFGDHHAFDYLWLAVTFAIICYLVRDDDVPRARWLLAIVGLGVALAAQTLSWEGSPLLLTPFAGVVFLLLLSTVWADQSPVSVVGPLVTGLALAVEIVAVAVIYLSWQTTTIIGVLLVQVAVLGTLLGLGVVGHRYVRWPIVTSVGILLLAALAPLLVYQHVPESTELLQTGLAYFTQTTGTVAEATSLFGGDNAVVTVISFFGPLFAVFVVALLWGSWQTLRSHRPGLLAVVTYAWYFLVLSAVQRRFAGELSLFAAVLVGVAVAELLQRRSELPTLVIQTLALLRGDEEGEDLSARTLRSVFAITLVCVFIVSVTVAQVPLTMENRIVTDAEYEAAQEMETYAAEHGSPTLVFSSIDSNLMYNYYVNDGNIWNNDVKENYVTFLTTTDENEWYRWLDGEGTGFVVVSSAYDVSAENAVHTKLQDNMGSTQGNVDGVGHYRLVFRSGDDSTTVYALVPGAHLVGNATPNERITVTTTVETPERTVVYRRTAKAAANGSFRTVVPYPGRYEVGDETVEVTERDVRSGANLSFPG